MNIQRILSPKRTFTDITGSSRKRVLEKVSSRIAEQIAGVEPDDVFDALIQREMMGSTGLGEGIAIPHCRLQNCPTVIGCLVRLREAIDFESSDDEPVDLLFVLLVPSEADDEHIETLAELATLFSKADFRERLRNAESDEALYQAATDVASAA